LLLLTFFPFFKNFKGFLKTPKAQIFLKFEKGIPKKKKKA